MRTVDVINDRFGRGTIRYLATGVRQRWQTRADLRSPRFTTHWQEILTISEKPSTVLSSAHESLTTHKRELRRTMPPFIKTDYEVH